jgi:hypothetical protein
MRTVSTLCIVLFAGSAHADVLHHWTQLNDGRSQSFRAIISDDTCPAIEIDGALHQMSVRAGVMPEFPNLVCEFATDKPVASAQVNTLRFPVRPERADRMVVVGDTGCRLKDGSPVQACNDPEEWPFATISGSIAEKEADLAIHVGDYYYRETECLDPDICGETYGDTWRTWEADFFAPGQTMLSAHPFVFVRGNHENCNRAWLGFDRYLAAEPMRDPLMCDNYQAPFVVEFDDLQLPVIDSSTRDRDTYTWDRLRAMQEQFTDVLPRLDRETLVLTHTPLWGYGSKKRESDELETLESIQRDAFGDMLPRLVSGVVAGDLHFAQLVSTPGNPVQITFGNGGVWLYTTPEGRVDDLQVGHGVTGDIFGFNQFGFGMIERVATGLDVTFFDQTGEAAVKCTAPASVETCAPEGV